ncbi:MAG TPA: dienelactone hydrolase family protein [Candidatus Omnitrophota bacterium]|nr:dienelactone hydrolase family protein [Candidatus Omnitrophota bacterium]HPD85051.1 dienelactone hydrolase family protein [Candidatus Omnitrophota bacterium]HRZ03909.1 dienelactone hydrolase family protein [Candidatus Omnitrophota bacterium]
MFFRKHNLFIGPAFVLILWLGHFLLFPCPSRAHEEEIAVTPEGYRYAVRLPSGYMKKANGYPVLFCFHPQGDGVETTRIFGYASYRLSWIIIGFMDLVYFELNEKSWPKVVAAQESVLKDVKKKYNVDGNRFYAAGFANGGQMAYQLAYKYPSAFKGIIACGSGLGLEKPIFSIPVYQCAGDDDYALDEARRAQQQIKDANAKVQLRIFKGGHEWPPQNIIHEALEWLYSIR